MCVELIVQRHPIVAGLAKFLLPIPHPLMAEHDKGNFALSMLLPSVPPDRAATVCHSNGLETVLIFHLHALQPRSASKASITPYELTEIFAMDMHCLSKTE